MASIIQMKRGTAAAWTSDDTVLANGEFGWETDTGYMKIGNGSTAWTSLGYLFTTPSTVKISANDTTPDFAVSKLLGTSGRLTAVETGDGGNETLVFDIVESGIDHNSLLNFQSNVHFTQASITALGTVVSGNVDAIVNSASVGLGNVENTALSTWAGTTNLTTLGTITTGTWTATALGANYVPDHDNLNNVTASEHLDWTQASVGTIHATNYVDNDTLTSLSAGTITATTYGITSDGGVNDLVLPEATTSTAGLLGAAKWDEIVANTAAQHAAATVSDTASVDLTLTGQQISAVVLPAGVDHDSLSNYDSNDHIDHTGVTLTAGVGLSGGGDISSNRTFDLDINSLPAGTIAPTDIIAFADTDDSNAVKYDLVSSLVSAINTYVSIIPDAGTTQVAVGAESLALTSSDSSVTITGSSPASLDTITFDVAPANVDHNSLQNYSAAQHVDWAGASAGTIHATNYVDNDTIYSHPNHTGEVTSTGDGAQALDKTAITNRGAGTVASGDLVLVSDIDDTNTLKKVTAQSIADLAGGGGSAFTTINCPTGTDPVASGADTLNLASADSKLTITGDSGTDTVTLAVVEGQIDHDALTNFSTSEHYLQSAITEVGTVTTGVWSGTALVAGKVPAHDDLTGFVAGEHFLQSAITEVGTIATGVWSGTALVAGKVPAHDDLTGFVAGEHVLHSGVTLTAGNGLSGGGDISASRSFALDASELSTATVATGDYVVIEDITDNSTKKVTAQSIADLAGGGSGTAPEIIMKTADESVTSSAVLQDDNDFTFSIAADETVVVECQLMMNNIVASPDITLQFTGPASPDSVQGAVKGMVTVTSDNYGRFKAFSSSVDIAGNATAPDDYIYIYMSVINGSNAGTVTLQWAQRIANAAAVTIEKGSWMKIHRL